MKIQLLILFVAACIAEEEPKEEYLDWNQYELLECKFPDVILVCPLDGHLVGNRFGAIDCYKQYRGNFESFAKSYRKNIVLAQNFYKQLDYGNREFAKTILQTIKQMAINLMKCQNKLWDKLKVNDYTHGTNVLYNCRVDLNKLYKDYESQLSSIPSKKDQGKMKKKIEEIHSSVKKNFDAYTKLYETCIENKGKHL